MRRRIASPFERMPDVLGIVLVKILVPLERLLLPLELKNLIADLPESERRQILNTRFRPIRGHWTSWAQIPIVVVVLLIVYLPLGLPMWLRPIALLLAVFAVPIALAPFRFLAHLPQIREKLVALGRCGQCGYKLHGNSSGVCPECGSAIESESVLAKAPDISN